MNMKDYQGSNDYEGYDHVDYYGYYDYYYDYVDLANGKPSIAPEISHDRSSNFTEPCNVSNTSGVLDDHSFFPNCSADEHFFDGYGCYPYDDNYEYDYPNTLKVYDFDNFVLGYVRPALVILTTLTNIIVVGYFLGNKSRGKATSLLFFSIAISDTLTGLILIPNPVYVYALGWSTRSYWKSGARPTCTCDFFFPRSSQRFHLANCSAWCSKIHLRMPSVLFGTHMHVLENVCGDMRHLRGSVHDPYLPSD